MFSPNLVHVVLRAPADIAGHHVHMIVPGGGLSDDGNRWISCKPNFFLPVRVLSRLFRRRVVEMLIAAHEAGRIKFFGGHAGLVDAQAFADYLAPLRKAEWVVYSKKPFGGPEAVLAYLSRYTHRVAISNRRLIAANETSVIFKFKDYRIEGPERYKTMTLDTGEFIRRFLMHVLPKGLHRIRHYRLLANSGRAENVVKARELPAVAPRVDKLKDPKAATVPDEPRALRCPCPCCGGRMVVIETFEAGTIPSNRPSPAPIAIRIDTS
jgi:Putative transposase